MTVSIKSFIFLAICIFSLNPTSYAQNNQQSRGNAVHITNSPDLTFKNNTPLSLKIYWVNNGKETLYNTLAAGTAYKQPTYSNHEWIARSTQGGQEVMRMKAGNKNESVNITLRSKNSNSGVKVSFKNNKSHAIKVFWVDYSGNEKRYATLIPNKDYTQSTYATHPWIIRHAETNAILNVYIPNTQATQYCEIGHSFNNVNNICLLGADENYDRILPNATDDDVQKSWDKEVEDGFNEAGKEIEKAAEEVGDFFKNVFDF